MVALSVGAAVAAAAAAAGDTVAAAQPAATPGCFMQHPCAVLVDQLKERLPLAIESADQDAALGIIASLEKLGLTKEVLEVTRVGAVVNEARKRTADTHPELSKRCRLLIKAWQRTVADSQRPLSSCEGSSNGGTPNLVSPALRSNGGGKSLTPGKRQSSCSTRTTSSSGLHVTYAADSQRASKISPSLNGSYAPRKPEAGEHLHKSQSVGAALCGLQEAAASAGDAEARCPSGSPPNGFLPAGSKRAGEEPPIPTLTLKRAKLGGGLVIGASRTGGSASSSPGAAQSGAAQSVTAARKNVQSTAELVALVVSENLPLHMGIDLKLGATVPTFHHSASLDYLPAAAAAAAAAVPVKSESETEAAAADAVAEANGCSAASAEKRKRSKKEKEERRERKEKRRRERKQEEPLLAGPLEAIAEEPLPSTASAAADAAAEPGGKCSFDWCAHLVPSMDSLRTRSPEHASPHPSATAPFVIPIRQRRLVAMPYVDIGVPDFLMDAQLQRAAVKRVP